MLDNPHIILWHLFTNQILLDVSITSSREKSSTRSSLKLSVYPRLIASPRSRSILLRPELRVSQSACNKRRCQPDMARARTVVKAGVSAALGSSGALLRADRVSSAFKREAAHVVGSPVPGEGVDQASTTPFSSRRRLRQVVLLEPLVVARAGIPQSVGSHRALRNTASIRCKEVRTRSADSASIPIGWLCGVSPSPSPDPLSSSRKPGAAMGTGTPDMGAATPMLRCLFLSEDGDRG